MLKNAMFWLMLAFAALRIGGLGYLLGIGETNLPALVLGVSACTAALMLGAALKKLLFGIKRRELEIIFLINSIVVLFNPLYITLTAPITVEPAEMAVTGTLFEVLAGVTFIFLSRRRTKYITIPQQATRTEAPGSATTTQKRHARQTAERGLE